MRDTYGDTIAALKAARAAGLFGTAFGGAEMPPFQSGHTYLPHWAAWDSGGASAIVANTLYRTWFAVPTTATFLGGWCRDSGAGNNAKNVRMGLFDKNGNLLKDFGTAGLTATPGQHNLDATITVQGPTIVQVALVSDSNPTMQILRPMAWASSVGWAPPAITNVFGEISPVAPSASAQGNYPTGDTAAFVYAAMPATITAATATLRDSNMPAMGLRL